MRPRSYMGEDEVFVWLVQTNFMLHWLCGLGKRRNDLAKIREKADGTLYGTHRKPCSRDFAFDTQDNGRMKLSEVQSPITILYFWDSDLWTLP